MDNLISIDNKKPIPAATLEMKPVPMVGKPENTVKIGDKIIEIKPTAILYHRARTAAFYKVIDLYPLPDIFAMPPELIGDPERDGDKCVFDWLIAATDDPELIKENYESIDTETVEKILEIFKRVNRIKDKEDRLKKMQAEKGEMA